ncbi:Two-component sensor histidine kinase, contains HisKA and HATPase domains [Chitinophaga sp. YR627]|uniref:histidine kinase dimerization/phosphoacceptor domain -containing protein n=1 Tax=Chitinophaga sp. YR627 TaxID=1881041 RepID=UPI0008E5C548|nr:histidine kinase dimerization/phosphoacceptor domain -containing protein [Chitinophaga sp. YR627]SFN30253.1 Two-component sensor histidine kinase, contains HisKA and HATPase domains [Chitinophaga sp. YR627]
MSSYICKYHIVFILLLCTTAVFAQKSDNEKTLLHKLANAVADSNKVRLFIETGNFYVNKPGSEAVDMQAALSYAKEAIALSHKLAFPKGEGGAYALLAQIYREKDDRKSGKAYAEKAISYFPENTPASVEAAAAYIEISTYYSIDNELELDTKIVYYTRAVRLLKQAGADPVKQADALKFLGDLIAFKGNPRLALQYLEEALHLYQAAHYTDIQDLYSLLGFVSVETGHLKEGLDYQLKGTRLIERKKDSSGTAIATYNRLGYIYNYMNNFADAAKAFEKALIYAKRNNDTSAIILITSNTGSPYIHSNQPRKAIKALTEVLNRYPIRDTTYLIHLVSILLEAHTVVKEYTQAERYYNQINPLVRRDHASEPYIANFHYAAINLFLGKQEVSKVWPHIDILKKIADSTKELKVRGSIERYQFMADSMMGNYQSAITHYQQYRAILDTVNKRNHDKQIAEMEIQFETEKKDIDIANKANDIQMLQKQNDLQKRALSSEAISRNLLFAGIALLGLILLLGYSRYRLKQQANKQLEQKQTSINLQNDSLKQLVNEREWLLKEIHHRVKNNLQIVISLLNSQSLYLKDNAALNVIRESQHRMNSISLIHQKLYQGDNLSGIDMRDYIFELAIYLQDSFDTRGKIAFMMDIERLMLDVSQAVPLGLILNEAITNAIKYAFKERQEDAKINISFRQQEQQGLLLSISDNGAGLPPDFDLSTSSSLGMNLMQGLTRQLGGTMECKNKEGFHIRIIVQKINLLGAKEQTKHNYTA